ncbi:MAG: DoxX family protein [Cyclobacteriaceae bacterium]
MENHPAVVQTLNKITTSLASVRGVLLWLSCTYLAYMFVKNGIIKFDPEGFWGPTFLRWGFPVWFLYLVGFLETAGGILILIPKARFFGAMTISAVMFGALITRFIHGLSLDDGFYIFFIAVCCLYIASLSKFGNSGIE